MITTWRLAAIRDILLPALHYFPGVSVDIQIDWGARSLELVGQRNVLTDGEHRSIGPVIRRTIPEHKLEDNSWCKEFKPMLDSLLSELRKKAA